MGYQIIISNKAQLQLDQFIYYLVVELGNEQAARNVLEDAEKTKIKLSHVADRLKYYENNIDENR